MTQYRRQYSPDPCNFDLDDFDVHPTELRIELGPLKEVVFTCSEGTFDDIFDDDCIEYVLSDPSQTYTPPTPNLPLADNEVVVETEHLDKFVDNEANLFTGFRDTFFDIAACLSSMNQAADYVQAALKDGLNEDITIDRSVEGALSSIVALKHIDEIINNLKLSPLVKEVYLKRIAELFADSSLAGYNRAAKRAEILDFAEKHGRIENGEYGIGIVRSRGKPDARQSIRAPIELDWQETPQKRR